MSMTGWVLDPKTRILHIPKSGISNEASCGLRYEDTWKRPTNIKSYKNENKCRECQRP